MSVGEAKAGTMICWIDDPDLWGVITCLSDDETTAYYKPRGMGFFRLAAPLSKIMKVG